MKKNLGSVDRVVRIIAPLVVGYLLLNGTLSGILGVVLGIVAVVLLLTGFFSFCPLYALLGVNSGAKAAVPNVASPKDAKS